MEATIEIVQKWGTLLWSEHYAWPQLHRSVQNYPWNEDTSLNRNIFGCPPLPPPQPNGVHNNAEWSPSVASCSDFTFNFDNIISMSASVLQDGLNKEDTQKIYKLFIIRQITNLSHSKLQSWSVNFITAPLCLHNPFCLYRRHGASFRKSTLHIVHTQAREAGW